MSEPEKYVRALFPEAWFRISYYCQRRTYRIMANPKSRCAIQSRGSNTQDIAWEMAALKLGWKPGVGAALAQEAAK